MLLELAIRNFAIIEDLRIRFSGGLTVLTGETGAGKSILINAVNLILGSRASSQLIRTGADSAEIEALFEVSEGSPSARALSALGHDPAEGLLIRRIISMDNRHRIYVNGRIATLQNLQCVTENLASISGQHAHQGLLKEEQHLLFLDQYADLVPLREAVGRRFRSMQPLMERLKEQEALQLRQAEETDLLIYQKKEILDAGITPGEDAALEAERLRLKNAESLIQAASEAVRVLYGEAGAVTEKLSTVKTRLDQAARIDAALEAHTEVLSEVFFKVEDTARELQHYLSRMEMDEGRLEAVEERLDRIGRLKKKYGGSIEAALEKLTAIEAALCDMENLSERIAQSRTALEEARKTLAEAAVDLSEKRRAAALQLASAVEMELATLNMAGTRFEVAVAFTTPERDTPETLVWDGAVIGETGIDRAAFLMAPNVGEALKPLAAIASGGELSRVVLALKAILAREGAVETIVFDEVDAGIGGATAERVGKKMADLAVRHQVLCITHLAPIARYGSHHFRITKKVVGQRTVSAITSLSGEERVLEIARMLAGEALTDASLDHARELLKNDH